MHRRWPVAWVIVALVTMTWATAWNDQAVAGSPRARARKAPAQRTVAGRAAKARPQKPRSARINRQALGNRMGRAARGRTARTGSSRPAETVRQAVMRMAGGQTARSVQSRRIPDNASHRERTAMRAVMRRVRGRLNAQWQITTPFHQYVGDATNPVTGSGPIEVIAKQKRSPRGLWRRMRHALSPNAERSFMVMVDPSGQPTILSSRPNSAPYRFMRRLTFALPVKEIAADVFRSQGVRTGLGMGAGSIAIGMAFGPAGWVASGALIYKGLGMMIEGVERRRVARKEAITQTVTSVERSLRRGQTVTLSEAYRTYGRILEDLKPGTRPSELRDFAEQLSSYGL